jgi:hypothetical protein
VTDSGLSPNTDGFQERQRREPIGGRGGSSPHTATAQQFTLTPRPPLRALAIGSVAAVIGALLVVLAGIFELSLVLTIIGIALLIFAVTLMVTALALTARLRTALALDAEAIRVTHGRRTRAVAWSGIESVGLQGPRLTFTPKGGEPAIVVVNPRSPSNPTFLALVAAVRERLNADRGYRSGF